MPGMDNLLVESLDRVIRDNLSEKTLQKIENRLFEKYGMSLTQGIKDFQKLDNVLRELFGAGAYGVEKNVLENVCLIEKSTENGFNWISIEDQHLIQKILEAFGDDDKKKILTTLTSQPCIISEVLKNCDLPQTSGYRKINSLIDAGLIIPMGYVTTNDGKKVSKYVSVFENIKIDIVKNKITVKVMICNESFKDSHMLPLIQSL